MCYPQISAHFKNVEATRLGMIYSHSMYIQVHVSTSSQCRPRVAAEVMPEYEIYFLEPGNFFFGTQAMSRRAGIPMLHEPVPKPTILWIS